MGVEIINNIVTIHLGNNYLPKTYEGDDTWFFDSKGSVKNIILHILSKENPSPYPSNLSLPNYCPYAVSELLHESEYQESNCQTIGKDYILFNYTNGTTLIDEKGIKIHKVSESPDNVSIIRKHKNLESILISDMYNVPITIGIKNNSPILINQLSNKTQRIFWVFLYHFWTFQFDLKNAMYEIAIKNASNLISNKELSIETILEIKKSIEFWEDQI